ncbi:MAG TPA: endonuclease [Edaphocola sp.]|nr:endonuclease [Edaphocola sp.]
MKFFLPIMVFGLLYTNHNLAQAPSNYYNGTQGLTGYALKTKLSQIISNGYIVKSYGELYNGYKTTDRDYYYENDGTILDMYSEKPNGVDAYDYSATSTGDRCGNYSSEGDCFNREHIIPQSLFNSASPMKSDINFVVPSDGYVNGKRSNYPFGKVNSPTWTSTNGSKLGSNASTGFSGTVFEPIDAFKGDIARMVFYFVTRYQSKIPGFGQGDILDGSITRGLQQWEADLLLQWHNQDTVSQREKDRNDAIYNYQGNRNPFIDHPEWVNCIWGNQNCIGEDTSTSVSSVVLQYALQLYPNPANSNVYLEAPQSIQLLSYTIFNPQGSVLLHEKINNTNLVNLEVSNLSNGIYFIKIQTDKGFVMKKFLKQ